MILSQPAPLPLMQLRCQTFESIGIFRLSGETSRFGIQLRLLTWPGQGVPRKPWPLETIAALSQGPLLFFPEVVT